ncbi:hypothetical protein N7509_012831 [Penicillium cosmopolitanum]|uniref:Alpha-galactosidase n=1 Tax=Penicillium cosmopolitanum TaxID=1131564 RepID=A0A9W9SDD7_9EURO|nr:uncharacterized protein N7509_012831 [Penicillium cosmopolitanum]KAJ5375945.1 hypothetical protein N7509_012831 [Penicillium cosmopolitanum]
MHLVWSFQVFLIGLANSAALKPRIDNGLAKTPPMGWNTYNHYACSPNEAIVKSNAKALVDLGLDNLGYRYVTIDCGWTIPDRVNGSLTWNETNFPSGFPAIGQYIHDLGLLFGVYEDAGIRSCQTDIEQAGSLYHEAQDAALFTSWKIDALKYDNCFSDEATGYPNVNYEPSTSPQPRFANMTKALAAQNRAVLFQICEWGIDFPALWAPALGHTWRIGNDIIPAWRAIWRTLNQAVPQTSFAGPGQWPDLDMLEVGNDILTIPEEQTHLSLWAILKSPLVIGGALKDDLTSINKDSLAILSNKDVIGFNQDSLGKSAELKRRWSEEGYEVWSGPLSNGRTVAALINWADETRELTLNLPDIGVQFAGRVKDIWAGKSVQNVKTSYTSTVQPHGVMLLELDDTIAAGSYSSNDFASVNGNTYTFESIYANTSSSNHAIVVQFASATKKSSLKITDSLEQITKTVSVPASQKSVSAKLALSAGGDNKLVIESPNTIKSIEIQTPAGKYYPCTEFSISGSAKIETCDSGFCKPTGSKLSYINSSNKGSANVQVTLPASSKNETILKYIEVDFTNNDIALSTSWGLGSNSRNITISVNDDKPVRLEVPLSGKHSELFGPGKGWWDTSTLGLLVGGWKSGDNVVVVGNEAGDDSFQSYGADFVGLKVFD